MTTLHEQAEYLHEHDEQHESTVEERLAKLPEYVAVRAAYEAGNITRLEAVDKLLLDLGRPATAFVILDLWDAILTHKAFQDVLESREHDRHLPHDTAIDLIDHAFLTGHITSPETVELFLAAGMTFANAHHHIDTLKAEKDKTAERANYLEFPVHAPAYCTRCGKMTPEHNLSIRRLCVKCGAAASSANMYQLILKDGPYYRKWRAGMMNWLYSLEDDTINEHKDQSATTLGDLIDKDDRPNCFGEHCGDDSCTFSEECALAYQGPQEAAF